MRLTLPINKPIRPTKPPPPPPPQPPNPSGCPLDLAIKLPASVAGVTLGESIEAVVQRLGKPSRSDSETTNDGQPQIAAVVHYGRSSKTGTDCLAVKYHVESRVVYGFEMLGVAQQATIDGRGITGLAAATAQVSRKLPPIADNAPGLARFADCSSPEHFAVTLVGDEKTDALGTITLYAYGLVALPSLVASADACNASP